MHTNVFALIEKITRSKRGAIMCVHAIRFFPLHPLENISLSSDRGPPEAAICSRRGGRNNTGFSRFSLVFPARRGQNIIADYTRAHLRTWKREKQP